MVLVAVKLRPQATKQGGRICLGPDRDAVKPGERLTGTAGCGSIRSYGQVSVAPCRGGTYSVACTAFAAKRRQDRNAMLQEQVPKIPFLFRVGRTRGSLNHDGPFLGAVHQDHPPFGFVAEDTGVSREGATS